MHFADISEFLSKCSRSHLRWRVLVRALIDTGGAATLPRFPALMLAVGLLPAAPMTAQTFRTLHNFTANSDGVGPVLALVSSNVLYGTAGQGGSWGNGTIFRVNTDGSGFTNLHSFTPRSAPYYTNDGAFPHGRLLLGNTLYGTAYEGGSSNRGTLFAINTDGSGFTNLHTFSDASGAVYPAGPLVVAGSILYGTAYSGGSSDNGAVYQVNTDGTGFSNLYSFAAIYFNPTVQDFTNSDGTHPSGGLILSGNTLYGTAYSGGCSANGAVFKLNTDGSGFTNLHSFTALDPVAGTNDDGANPVAGLILSGNVLYGTAVNGGSSGYGAVFKLNTDGTDFSTLHGFTALDPVNYTNSDGAAPYDELILSGNTLYGTAARGGCSGRGTVFAVNTDGSAFVTLHCFAGSDGADPSGPFLSSDTLYGATSQFGSSDNGTLFSLSFMPQLTLFPSGTNLVLAWPTNYAGFDFTSYTLQSTTNLVSPVIWSPVSPPPVVVNGQNTVTNFTSGHQQFFRLSK